MQCIYNLFFGKYLEHVPLLQLYLDISIYVSISMSMIKLVRSQIYNSYTMHTGNFKKRFILQFYNLPYLTKMETSTHEQLHWLDLMLRPVKLMNIDEIVNFYGNTNSINYTGQLSQIWKNLFCIYVHYTQDSFSKYNIAACSRRMTLVWSINSK